MYHFEMRRLPDLPLIINSPTEDWTVAHDLLPMLQMALDLLDREPNPIYLLTDARSLNLNLADLIQAAHASAGHPDSLLHHPHLIELLAVTERQYLKMVAKGLNSEIFGFVQMRVFTTIEVALDYVREQSVVR